MANSSNRDVLFSSDPVRELLRGGDPAEVALRAGISLEELFRERDIFLEARARRAWQEEVLPKVGRNDPCPCGSGLKYKKCCLPKNEEAIAGMGSEEIRLRSRQKRQREKQEERVREGYGLLTREEYLKARAFARRQLEEYPEDDRLYDILTTSGLYLGNLDEAVKTAEARWKAAQKEKDFFLAQGRHSYDDPGVPPGHSYSPQAWQERCWVAIKACEYRANYPPEPDPQILLWVKELQKADDLKRFPEQREEGLRVRKEALAESIQAIKDAGLRGLPYLLPLCTRYGWSALLIPDILCYWKDDASIRTLVEISLFHYPFLSESCLKALEQLGELSLPYLQEAFQRNREFDSLKIGLISVAGQIGTPDALGWVTRLLDHPDPVIVNWSAGVLGKCGHISALKKIKEAGFRLGENSRTEWAVDELNRLQNQR
jgi:hypothetical protein